MKKILAGVALAGILALSVGTVAAQAAPDYTSGPTSTVSSGTVDAGSPVVFSGGGFTPGETIDITATLTNTVAGGAVGAMGGGVSMGVLAIVKPAAPISMTAVAAADGTFSTNVTLTQTGTYTLTATGRTSGVTVSQVVKVVAEGPAGTKQGNDGNVAGGTIAGGAQGAGGGLASTGVDPSVLVWSLVGAGALGAGITTVAVARRRNRAEQGA